MVYGELGLFSVDVKSHMLKFWENLINDNVNKYSSLMYKVIYNLYNSLKEEQQITKFNNNFKWFCNY